MNWILNTAGLYQTREGIPVTVVATNVRLPRGENGIAVIKHELERDIIVTRHINGDYSGGLDCLDIILVPPKPVGVDMYVYMSEVTKRTYLCSRTGYGSMSGGHSAHIRWVDGVLEIVEQKHLGDPS